MNTYEFKFKDTGVTITADEDDEAFNKLLDLVPVDDTRDDFYPTEATCDGEDILDEFDEFFNSDKEPAESPVLDAYDVECWTKEKSPCKFEVVRVMAAGPKDAEEKARTKTGNRFASYHAYGEPARYYENNH